MELFHFAAFVFQVEFVEEAVDDRSENNGEDGDQGDAAVKGETAGKQFAGVGLHAGDGAHAGQNHGGIQESIDPGQFFKYVIAGHADAKRNEDDRDTHGRMPYQALIVNAAREEWFGAMFVHLSSSHLAEPTTSRKSLL